MIVVRFKVKCRHERIEDALAAFGDVVAPSRATPGVIYFDIGRDLVDPDSIIATEVFDDRAALERQESLPEVGTVMSLFPELIAGEPEATVYEVAATYPYSE